MQQNAFVGIFMLLLAALLITMGVQGSLGKVVAVMFVPSELMVNSQQQSLLTYTQQTAFVLPNVPTNASGTSLL